MDNPYRIAEDELRIREGIWNTYMGRVAQAFKEGLPDEAILTDPLMDVARKYVSVTNKAIAYLRSLDPETVRRAELADRTEVLRRTLDEGLGEEESDEELARKAFGLESYTLEQMMQGELDEDPQVNTIQDAEDVFTERGYATHAYHIRIVATRAWDIKNSIK